MASYYRFRIPIGKPCGYVAKDPDADFSLLRLLRAIRLDDRELPEVCRFTMRARSGRPIEPADCYLHVHLMSRRMLSILHSVGVSNLQTWAAEIRILGTDQLLTNYVVFNVVGSLTCADSGASQSVPLAEGRFFTELTVNPRPVGGARMFRLAESLIEIIVDEDVARALGKGGLSHVELEALDETDS
jgi:hypothetical protein